MSFLASVSYVAAKVLATNGCHHVCCCYFAQLLSLPWMCVCVCVCLENNKIINFYLLLPKLSTQNKLKSEEANAKHFLLTASITTVAEEKQSNKSKDFQNNICCS